MRREGRGKSLHIAKLFVSLAQIRYLEEKLSDASNEEREARQKVVELRQENIRLTQRLENAGINAVTLSPIKEGQPFRCGLSGS